MLYLNKWWPVVVNDVILLERTMIWCIRKYHVFESFESSNAKSMRHVEAIMLLKWPQSQNFLVKKPSLANPHILPSPCQKSHHKWWPQWCFRFLFPSAMISISISPLGQHFFKVSCQYCGIGIIPTCYPVASLEISCSLHNRPYLWWTLSLIQIGVKSSSF